MLAPLLACLAAALLLWRHGGPAALTAVMAPGLDARVGARLGERLGARLGARPGDRPDPARSDPARHDPPRRVSPPRAAGAA